MQRRRMMMAQGGVSLPAGYTALEYLESSGSNYIDTGFKPNQNTRVVCDAQALGRQDTGIAMAIGGGYYYSLFIDSGTVRTGYGTEAVDTFATNAPAYYERLIYDKNKNVTTVGGYTITHNAATFQLAYSLYLFARNNAGTTDWFGKVRLYSCQIYDNDTKVRDYLPCINPDGREGLWDTVTQTFFGWSYAGITILPYIESDGTNYIDTEFKPNNNTRVVFEGYNNSTSSIWIFGAWKAKNDKMFAAAALNTYNVCYGAEIWANATMPVGPISIDINKNAYTYNGVSGTLTAQTFSCDYPMYLFRINAAGTVSTGSFNGRIYSVKIYDNGALVRDYYPAEDSSGTKGLYDVVNDVFYPLLKKKEKVENKISLSKSFVLTAISQFSVASTISVAVRCSGYANIDGNMQPISYDTTITIFKGDTQSTATTVDSRLSYTITSISPTEDDTYIYTF